MSQKLERAGCQDWIADALREHSEAKAGRIFAQDSIGARDVWDVLSDVTIHGAMICVRPRHDGLDQDFKPTIESPLQTSTKLLRIPRDEPFDMSQVWPAHGEARLDEEGDPRCLPKRLSRIGRAHG